MTDSPRSEESSLSSEYCTSFLLCAALTTTYSWLAWLGAQRNSVFHRGDVWLIMESGAPDEDPESPEMGSDDRPGRLGAQEVHFKVDASTRNVLIDEESMRVESTANFATVAADVCVFDGRWMYEVLHPHPTNRSCKLVIRTASDCMVRPPKVTLGTAGIQQLGWAAFGCQRFLFPNGK